MANNQIKRIAILTSGGDAPGMNACIRAIVRSALFHNIEPYGVQEGYLGLIKDEMDYMDYHSVSQLGSRGGTMLCSARFPMFKDEDIRKQAIINLKKRKIDALVCIGGDGTYRGAGDLAKMGFPVICIPGTVDNDISSTEYTIGFDTTLNTIVSCVDKLRDTIFSHNRAAVVEVMGRHNPDLAIRAGIACGAEYVLCNEDDYSDETIIEVARKSKERGKKSILMIVCENTVPVSHIADVMNKDGTYETKSDVLGHIQRGGTPSAFDRVLAARLGDWAIDLLLQGITGVAVGIYGEELIYTNLEEANKQPSKYPTSLIAQSDHFI